MLIKGRKRALNLRHIFRFPRGAASDGLQVTTMGPGRDWQTRNIKYPKLSRAMTMPPLYNHQHPGQVIKAQNQENHNISPSQPQVRGGAQCYGPGSTPWHFNLDKLP